jgi:hypothetical protein
MDWEIVVKVAVPAGTFFLGVLSTWLFKRQEEKKTLLRHHAQEVSRLTNEWYNQLHEIRAQASMGLTRQELRHKIDSYVSNRLILPKVLLSLEVLRGYSQAALLVREVEEFLKIITEYRQTNHHERYASCIFIGLVQDPLRGEWGHLEDLLQQLDRRLQAISAISAGILLGRDPRRVSVLALPSGSPDVRRLAAGRWEGPSSARDSTS